MTTLREEFATILETVARDGLSGPRDLDVALDAMTSSIRIEQAKTISVMQEFVDRVDRGEIRSVRTYAAFKDILDNYQGA